MKTISFLALAALAFCGLVSPASGEATAGNTLPASNNAFALDLYGAIREGDHNIFVSPYSISVALWMASTGARTETAQQMRRVLHLGTVSDYPALAKALKPPVYRPDPGVFKLADAYELSVANALWGQQGYPFKRDFLGGLAKDFGAPLQRIDFHKQEAARKAINDWVEANTRGKIKDIVPAGMPDPDTRLTLANAIYFKANWKDKFYDRATKEGDFTLLGGGSVKARLMHRVDNYRYADLGVAHAVELPYKKDASSMVVFLPKKRGDLASLERALCGGELRGWEKKLASRRVDVKLPKFKFTQSLDLTDTLQKKLGMGLPFRDEADFSGMTDAEKIWIGAVLHKAFIAVDEEGTEAAAATVLMMVGRAMAPQTPPVVVHADHPFVFMIRHRSTGTILFMGRVTDPSA